MKYFLDTEFIEDGRIIDPISIGIVCDDGREYYAEFKGVGWKNANEWVLENVKPHLTGEVKSKGLIAHEIRSFVGPDPEFWAYYADYDWVLLCQLYGTMMDLPDGWPMFCMDLKQYVVTQGNPRFPDDFPRSFPEHHALGDAHELRQRYQWLRERDNETQLRTALDELWVQTDDWIRSRLRSETHALATSNHNVLAHWRRHKAQEVR